MKLAIIALSLTLGACVTVPASDYSNATPEQRMQAAQLILQMQQSNRPPAPLTWTNPNPRTTNCTTYYGSGIAQTQCY